MAVKTLDALTALVPGADLWIVSDLERSKWARKIDGYLNFQLMRAEPKASPELSPELRTIMDSWDFEAPSVEIKPDAPLMVASSDLLPNRQTVLVPFEGNAEEWVAKCHSIWLGLRRPSLRIFLPDSFKAEVLERSWARSGIKGEPSAVIEIVPDVELLPA